MVLVLCVGIVIFCHFVIWAILFCIRAVARNVFKCYYKTSKACLQTIEIPLAISPKSRKCGNIRVNYQEEKNQILQLEWYAYVFEVKQRKEKNGIGIKKNSLG